MGGKHGQRDRQTPHWVSLLALFWVSCYVASHHLAVAPQSGAKDQFIELYLKRKAQRVSKKEENDRVRVQN